jgi:BirA family biotin operon repressor/biotin-[acetyl-CoA-carboxylase] ligase
VPTATSLLLAGAVALDRGPLLVAVLEELGARLARWRAAGGDPEAGLREEYLARCVTLGRDVRVELPGGAPLLGRAVGVDASGRLEVSSAGRVHAVGAGDVVHVRPVTGDVP